ncbi:MAG: Uncharacterised protein [Opitutia bacterium UBA7350]|nr:MAG: Uncharacterised protein [Opitutae bacterium UBA7350]
MHASVASLCFLALAVIKPSFLRIPMLICLPRAIKNLCVYANALLWATVALALYTEPENPFIAPNEVSVVLDISSGTITEVQQQIDAARAANPEAFLIINLSGTYVVNATPLVLSSKQILYLDGTIEASSSAATANSLISVGPGQSLVAVMGYGTVSMLDGQNADMHGIEVLASSRLIVDDLIVRNTLRDGISVQGLGNTVWDAQISISRCNVNGSGASGIRLYDANQCAVVDNNCSNNFLAGINLSADTSTLAHNICKSNATGVSVSGETNSVYKNICDNNAIGINLLSTSRFSTVTGNSISGSSAHGIALQGSSNTVFDNSYSNNNLDLDSLGSNNFIFASMKPLDGTGNNYFYPPTARNPHNDTAIINGMGRRDITIYSTTIDAVQLVYNAALAAYPNDVIVLNLQGTFTLGANPLSLSSNTCVLLETNASIVSDAATTALNAIVGSGESNISVSGGTLNANLQPVGGMQFLNCSNLLVDEVTIISAVDKTIRGENDLLRINDTTMSPKIVRGCKIDTGNLRGIWIQSPRAIITENVVSNCNKDGIDLDSFSSRCFVANNTCTDNVRYGVFIEEAATRNVVIDNQLHRNQIGVNVYTYEVSQPTQYNAVLCNFLDANYRGLRSGERDTPINRDTAHNYFYNNLVTNSEEFDILSGNNGVENYFSENALGSQSISASNSNTVFFNPSKLGSIQNTSGLIFDLSQSSAWSVGALPEPLDMPSFQQAGTFTAPASGIFRYAGISIDSSDVAINPAIGGNAYTLNLGSGGISGSYPLLVMGQGITLNVGANDQTWSVPLNNFRAAIEGTATITYTDPSRLWLRSYDNYNFEGIWRADGGIIHPEVVFAWSGANARVPAQILNDGGIRLSNILYERIGLDLEGNGRLIASGNSEDVGSAATLGRGSWSRAGDVWGSGNLTVSSNENYGKIIIAGDVSHRGNTIVDDKLAGMVLELSPSSTYTFNPTSAGVTNQIKGLNPANSKLIANGSFIINTTNANITNGNTWTLVDRATLGVSFGSNFFVQGFSESSGIWRQIDGYNIWSFSEATGALSLQINPYALIGLPLSNNFESSSMDAQPNGFAAIEGTAILGQSLNVISANTPFLDGPGSAISGDGDTQALYWLDTNVSSSETNPSLYLIDLDNGLSQDVVIRFSFNNVNENNSSDGLRLQIYDDALVRGVRLDLDSGGRTINNGSAAEFLEYPGMNKWSTVEITTNLSNNTYDLVIQREDEASPSTYPDLAFSNPISNIGRIAFVDFSNKAVNSEYYLDDISITPVIVEAYDNWALGKGLTFGINEGYLDDPDGDEFNNLSEFSLAGDPLRFSANSTQTTRKLTSYDSDTIFSLTFPARDGASFSGTNEQVSAAVDGVIYRVRGSNDLQNWTLVVNEVMGAAALEIQAGLPSLSDGWSYRTFQLPPINQSESRQFIQLQIDSP